MPSGVARDRRWRGLEAISDWIARQTPPACACGCGTLIAVKPAHRHRGIPRFAHGHHMRGAGHWNYKDVARWVVEQRGRHQCACGCGGGIRVVAKHHASGIPKYLPKHAPPPRVGVGTAHPAYKRDRASMPRRSAAAFGAVARKIIFNAFCGRCAWCGSTDAFEFDHVIPVSEGGSGEVSNAQLLCANCHRWKTAITPNYRERRAALATSTKESAHARHW